MYRRGRLLLLALGAALLLGAPRLVGGDDGPAPPPPPTADPDDLTPIVFREVALDLPEGVREPERFTRADLDGDGEAELILIQREARRLAVWRAQPDAAGRVGFERRPVLSVPLPKDASVVELAPAGEIAARPTLLVLAPDRLLALPIEGPPEADAIGLGEPRLLARVASPIPGDHDGRIDLLRDLDGDGRREVVVPTDRGFSVFTPDGRGKVAPAYAVEVAREVTVDLGPDDPDLLGRPGAEDQMTYRSVIRDVEPRDADGDGRPDLLVRDELRAFVYRGREGSFSPRPDFTVDFSRYLDDDATKLEVAGREIDLGNLFSVTVRDIDGDGALDYVANAPRAGKVVIVRGNRDFTPPPGPSQIIRISGNPLVSFLEADVDEDGLDDLLVVRLPDLDVLSLIGMVVVGSVEIDILGYDQRAGELFPAEPDRWLTFEIDFSLTRLVKLVDRYEEHEELLKSFPKVPGRAVGDVDGDGKADFVVPRLREDGHAVARLFRRMHPNELYATASVMQFLDEVLTAIRGPRGEKATLTFTVEEIFDEIVRVAKHARARLDADEGTLEIDLGPVIAPEKLPRLDELDVDIDELFDIDDIELELTDLDGDGREDLLVYPVEKGGTLRVLLSEPGA